MAFSTTSILLILYLASETIRANSTFYALYTYPTISASSIILLSEFLKLLVAIFFLFRHPTTSSFSASKFTIYISVLKNPREIDWRRQSRYAIPAAIYLINNLVYYSVLPLTSPVLLQVCLLIKLPITGILQHFTTKPQRNPFAWLSLLILCLGLAIFNIHYPSSTPIEGQTNKETAWYVPLGAGLLIASWTALGSLSADLNVKEGEFWESQALLYVWGTVFAVLTYPITPSKHVSSPLPVNVEGEGQASDWGLTLAFMGAVFVTAASGLAVAILLRVRHNSLKMLGMALCVVTVALSQFALFPGQREGSFSSWKVFGGGIVVVSGWLYNYYSMERWNGEGWSLRQVANANGNGDVEEGEKLMMVEGEEDGDREVVVEKGVVKDEGAMPEDLRPSVMKISGCAVVIVLVSFVVALRTGM